VVQFPTGPRDFLFSPKHPDKLLGPPSLYSVCTVGSFPQCKAAGHEVNDVPPQLPRLGIHTTINALLHVACALAF